MEDNTQFTIFKTVFVYVAFILVSPVLTFFVTNFLIFEGIFGLSSTTSKVWSAVLSIVVLHIALGMYIHKAYSESDRPKAKPLEKVD